MTCQCKLEILDKPESRPIYDEKEFDKIQVGDAIQDVNQRFDITWPDNVLVSTRSVIDRDTSIKPTSADPLFPHFFGHNSNIWE